MSNERYVLLVAHAGASESQLAAVRESAAQAGFKLVYLADAPAAVDVRAEAEFLLGEGVGVADLELVLVVGGDGTILKAAELVREVNTPIFGINVGHVGFLAEGEFADLRQAMTALAAGEYVVVPRLTLEARVTLDDGTQRRMWALNEVSVEKNARERMLEVALEVEGQELTSFGCDGVLFATPTGSTAYAFSAGGPVIWPGVEAMLVVPISAHALFARPLVVEPETPLALRVLRRSASAGVLWCDGRRSLDLPPEARVSFGAAETPVRLVQLNHQPFTNRLVNKFSLPVTGWRGPEN